MPHGRVTEDLQIYLGGDYFPISSRVRRVLASQRPQKIALGDYTAEQNPIVSTITWTDWREGVGRDSAVMPRDARRASWSELDLSTEGHLVLPALFFSTSNHVSSATAPIGAAELSGTLYAATAATALSVQSLNDGTGVWTNVRTLATAPTDIKAGRVGGTMTLCVATSSEVDYSTDGTTWARNTTDIKFIEFWKDLLWGIDNAGLLYFTTDLSGAWVQVAQLPLPAGYISKLFVGHQRDGESALYLATKVGLYIYDAENERILPTPLAGLPYHPAGGAGATEWATTGKIYYAHGMAVYEYDSVTGVSRSLGLELLTGISSYWEGGWVLSIVPGLSHLWMIAGFKFDGASFTPTLTITDNYRLFRWNQLGFDFSREVIEYASVGAAPNYLSALIRGTTSIYRLYAPEVANFGYIDLPKTVQSTAEVAGQTFDSASVTHYTPWIQSDPDQTWTALEVLIDSIHPTTSETVTISYATNFVETYTVVATKNLTGQVTYNLPPKDEPLGVPFRAFKLRLALIRGATTTRTPDVRKMTLVYSKGFRVLWGFEVIIPLVDGPRPARETRKLLEAAIKSDRLLEFTFKDEEDQSENHFVKVYNYESTEASGHAEAGSVKLTLVEAS